MNIVIATPLYPPDIAEPGPYVKELARRLHENHHTVTVVLFGRLPETVPGVTFVSIDKRKLLPVRLFRYFVALWDATKGADALYVMNGPSVEITAGILTLLRRIPTLVYLGDKDANEWISNKPHLRLIKRFVISRASDTLEVLPSQRPEILPFNPKPFAEFAAFEQIWQQHMENVERFFANAKKNNQRYGN